jgi:hypothetical protein
MAALIRITKSDSLLAREAAGTQDAVKKAKNKNKDRLNDRGHSLVALLFLHFSHLAIFLGHLHQRPTGLLIARNDGLLLTY